MQKFIDIAKSVDKKSENVQKEKNSEDYDDESNASLIYDWADDGQ